MRSSAVSGRLAAYGSRRTALLRCRMLANVRKLKEDALERDGQWQSLDVQRLEPYPAIV
jgi:hypothetical protein